jgi:hypothetical protein
MERIDNLSYCKTTILGRGQFSTVFKDRFYKKKHGWIDVAVKQFLKKETKVDLDKMFPRGHYRTHPNIVTYYNTPSKEDNFKYSYNLVYQLITIIYI